jgi:hypothetical protein
MIVPPLPDLHEPRQKNPGPQQCGAVWRGILCGSKSDAYINVFILQ